MYCRALSIILLQQKPWPEKWMWSSDGSGNLQSAKSTENINDLKLFRHLSETSKSLLARGLRYTQYTKTTPVLQKGQKISGAYVVVSGQLRVFTLSPDGNEATLYLINPGETCVLAVNCIFNDLLYPAWVEAGPGTRVVVIPGAVFRVLFESEPSVRDMAVQAFSTIVFRLMTELEQVHSCKLEDRLANFLLLHASTDGKVRMTQQEIASHLGTTREVIARVLGRLASERHIQTGRNMIAVNDPVSFAEFISCSGSKRRDRRRSSNGPSQRRR
jgi:CRP/FNR family transcriptional regulator